EQYAVDPRGFWH
ncbi:hypothetical protein A2U01_0100951, partial [Trifolium medium]|nr:hypothetical protein [Trifolium medium]